MNKKNEEIEEFKDWILEIETILNNMIIAANNYLEQCEKIPKLHDKLAVLEETLCTAQLNIQKIKDEDI